MCGPRGQANAPSQAKPRLLELRVVGAVSGELRCSLLADPSWSVRRLKTEIANVDGSPARSQRLMLGNLALADDQIVDDAVEGDDSPTLSLVRLPVLRLTPRRAGQESVSVDSAAGISRIAWTVDARRLQTKDKQAVSQPFELDFGGRFQNVTCKVLIYPPRDVSFQKARGVGSVKLKCEMCLPEAVGRVSFTVSVGEGRKLQGPRGPFPHSFVLNSVCGLPRSQEEFDLAAAVREDTMTFLVCFELASLAAVARSP